MNALQICSVLVVTMKFGLALATNSINHGLRKPSIIFDPEKLVDRASYATCHRGKQEPFDWVYE